MSQLDISTPSGNRQKTPAEIKVLSNHIYEYKKGIRPLVLYTFSHKYEKEVTQRLESQQIPYLKQKAGKRTINLFFGRPECLEAIAFLAGKPLYCLTPEEDFILGALLGYDICRQCERYCHKKKERLFSKIKMAKIKSNKIFCSVPMIEKLKAYTPFYLTIYRQFDIFHIAIQ